MPDFNKMPGWNAVRPVAAAVLSGGSLWLTASATGAPAGSNWTLLAVGSACSGGAAFSAMHVGKSRTEKEQAAVMEAAINPLLAELSSLVADPVERPEEKKRIIQRAVDTAGQLTGRTALSCLYWLDETSETLQRYAFNEAARGMPAEFTTDPAQKGSFLIGIARAPVGRHVKKISSDLDRQRIYMHDGCEAAYFVPVCVGLALKGLLVIQAKKAGSISRTESANKRIETLLNFVMAVKLEKSPQGHIPGQPVGPPPVPDGEVSVPPVG